MDLRLPALWLMMLACGGGRTGDHVTDVPTSIPPAADATTGAPAVPAVVPTVDLGPGFEPIGFVPGRYAVLVERNMAGVHARYRVTHRSSASLVLELGADGSATACHGWKNVVLVDGPGGPPDHQFRVQLGFRGTHVVRDGEVDVTLTADSAGCAEVREGQAPARREAMTLRCVLARPRGHATLTAPVLFCDWREANAAGYYPLAVHDVAPERWIVLGGGNGLRARVTGKAVSTEGRPVKTAIEPSATQIEADAWDGRLPLPESIDDL